MIHSLRYCCAMCFALISFLLAPPLSAQAQTREAYVSQSADKTTLTFYYDALRATRTGKSWGIEETKKEGDYTFPAWAGTWDVTDSTTTRVVFDVSFRNFRPTTTAEWFCNYRELKQVEGLEYLNTSEVKDMSYMFFGCFGLTSLDLSHFNIQNVTDMGAMFSGCWRLTSLDVSHFNTQNVTDMGYMFSGCSGLTSLDLSHFNTQNVTNMGGMFSGCRRVTSLDLSHFNTKNVTDMHRMFSECRGVTSLDLSHFNTQNVTDMGYMFFDCFGLTSLDLSHFNTQNVTDMGGMFGFCHSLPSLDVSNFNTQNVTEMAVMFQDCSGLTSLDVSNFNTQNVTDMDAMFRDCSGLTSLDVSNFNTQNVTSMQSMFSSCSGLTSLDLSHFKTQKVTDMSWMFHGCSGLSSLDLSHFNTQNVTDMSYMFSDCSALATISSNTAWQCPQSEKMFAGCTQLKGAVAYDGKKTDAKMANPETGYFTRSNDGGVEAYVAQSADKTTLTFYYDDQRATRTGKSWGIEETKKEGRYTFPAWAGTWEVADSTTTRVVFDASFRDFRPTTTASWFYKCLAIKQIEGLEFLNTSEVKDMGGMFYGCSGLTSLDVSHFDTQNVTDMRQMFNGCSGLTSLDVSNFNTQNVTSMGWMFSGCSGLTSLDVSHFNTRKVSGMSEMFSGCSGLTSLDLSHFNTQKVTNMSSMFWGCSALTSIRCNTDWHCPKSEGMFAGCTKLKGAVAYDKYKTDVTMADPETGYFTAKPTTVESVRFGADDAQHIYTLQGKRVRGAWKHLPAGVYVVNGKKTVKP